MSRILVARVFNLAPLTRFKVPSYGTILFLALWRPNAHILATDIYFSRELTSWEIILRTV